MNRKNLETTKLRLRDRAKSLVAKMSAASALSMAVVGSAMAQDFPETIEAAAAWVTTKATPIIAFVVIVSLIIVGIKIAKLPRRA